MGARTARTGVIAIALLAIATVTALAARPASAASPQMLLASVEGGRDTIVLDVARLHKWQRVRDWLAAPRGTDPALHAWAAWAQSLRGLPAEARLEAINSRVNTSLRYASDFAVWGVSDYWETPAEVVAKGATDCEGFAIMKLWLAQEAGLASGGLELLVGILQRTGQMHAVLLAGAGDRPMILDVLRPQMMSSNSFMDFRPIVAADLQSLTMFVGGNGTALAVAGF
ncbi:MAG: transglutaminase-like cysteine peptidase [Dongiaceae bacterium]